MSEHSPFPPHVPIRDGQSQQAPLDRSASVLLKDRYRVLTPLSCRASADTFFAIDEDKPTQTFCVIRSHPLKVALSRESLIRWEQLSRHPHIPHLLASFDRDDRQYLVQAYVMGQNAEQSLAQSGAWRERQIRKLLDDVLPVLSELHDRHLVHRDIKPQNLIRRQADDRWILVDFGSLHCTAVPGMTSNWAGSAEYAAPEQLQGHPVPSSDLYSLGIVCLHLLTSAPPFELYDDKNDVWNWRDRCRFPVSAQLGRILDRMVAREVPNRYPSAKAILKDLHGFDITPLFAPMLLVRPALLILLAISFGSSALQSLWNARSTPSPLDTQTRVPETAVLSRELPVNTLVEGTGVVWSVAVSPDGRSIVIGKANGSVEIRQFSRACLNEDCPPQVSFAAHTDPVWSVAVSPDNRTLATASEDKTIKLWDFQTGELIATWDGYSGEVYDIAFSPDGRVLASASEDGTVKLWDATRSRHSQRSKPLHTLTRHRAAVTSIDFSDNGRVLATASKDGTVKLWDFQTGKYLKTLVDLDVPIWSVAVSPDGQMVATGSGDTTVRLWDMGNGRRLRVFTEHSKIVQSLAFSPMAVSSSVGTGYVLASADPTGTVFLLHSESGSFVRLKPHAGWLDLAFSPDGTKLWSGGFDSAVKWLDWQAEIER
ncbi:MAG: serine/threonine protein kinase [Cyanobacteria bacterium SID2]|nr:serine/threonine protein kinase [Cyanobacteria bacterium SID2]MBP0005864.1 serine/threonine protein kinase [Cyanobacteria bacterium SBC]